MSNKHKRVHVINEEQQEAALSSGVSNMNFEEAANALEQNELNENDTVLEPIFNFNREKLTIYCHELMSKACNNLIKDGYVLCVVKFVRKTGKESILVLPTTDHESKSKLGILLRRVAPQMDAIFIISECWTLKPEDINSYNQYESISKHDKRVEAITLNGCSMAGQLMMTKTFGRDIYNRPIIDDDAKAFPEVWKSFECASELKGIFGNPFVPEKDAVNMIADVI